MCDPHQYSLSLLLHSCSPASTLPSVLTLWPAESSALTRKIGATQGIVSSGALAPMRVAGVVIRSPESPHPVPSTSSVPIMASTQGDPSREVPPSVPERQSSGPQWLRVARGTSSRNWALIGSGLWGPL